MKTFLAIALSLALFRTFSSRIRTKRPPAPLPLPMDWSIGRHEVFISHRGLDMKRGFANHLYHTLKQRGIKAFLNMEELPQGHDARPFMLEAARKAIIQVPIFTRTYAESSSCLDELVEMMNSSKRSSKVKLFPVFYDVKSEELGERDGPFAKAIKAHREQGKHNEDRITGWKDALRDACMLEGFRLDSYNKFEGELIQDLVAKIEDVMQDRPQRDIVGLEERVDDVVERLQLKEKRIVYLVLLWGMDGIGKTTLARAIHNRLGKEFEATSMVENCWDKTASQIQSQLSNDLLRNEESVKKSREAVRGFRQKDVLIILDNVKNYDSITEVVDPTSLHPGSRILVTSRDRTVFPHRNKFSDCFKGELYEVRAMDCDESLRLFCLHAFKKPYPAPGFNELAETISKACNGLPLSLEVLGRHLRIRKENEFWKDAAEVLVSNAHQGIASKLMISYNALAKYEQEMFLDVACLMIDESRRSAEYFWDGLVVGWRSGLQRLVELGLVQDNESFGAGEMDKHKRLTMHDQLRELGRGIAEEEYKKSGKLSRLWDDTYLLSKVLESKQGLHRIHGLAATSLPSLDAASLFQMRSLRLLFLGNTRLDGHLEGTLKGLQIKWLNFCGKAPPKELHSDFLSVLKLHLEVSIELPFSCGQLTNLRKLDMNCCERLPEDFGFLQCLEELDLRGSALVNLPSSFGQLSKLCKLNLDGCRGLKQLPEDFGSLQNLEELGVCDSAIARLPSSFAHLIKLRKVYMDGCGGLNELPYNFGSLESLEELGAWRSAIATLPSSFGQLKNLRKLNMDGCKGLNELPDNFGCLASLEELDVRGSAITKLPSSFGQLPKLRKLDMDRCKGLKELPEDFGSLASLEWLGVRESAITRLPSSFGHLQKLRKLDTDLCGGLNELADKFGSLDSLEELGAWGSAITKLPSSLGHLKNLRKLDMDRCKGLKELPEDFGSLKSLEELGVRGSAITKLPSSFGHLRKLRKLDMDWCGGLNELPDDFGFLESLEELGVWGAAISKLPSSFGHLKKLRKLNMDGCKGLNELPDNFGCLTSLEELGVRNSAISKLPSSFRHLKKLRKLDMDRCKGLKELPEDLGSLGSLEELGVRGSAITRLPSSFGRLQKLRKLDMDWCEGLNELPDDFGSLKSLEELGAWGSAISKLPSSFGHLKNLRKLDMDRCKGLKELPENFGSLESLEELRVSGSAITTLLSSLKLLRKLRKLVMKELPSDFASFEGLNSFFLLTFGI